MYAVEYPLPSPCLLHNEAEGATDDELMPPNRMALTMSKARVHVFVQLRGRDAWNRATHTSTSSSPSSSSSSEDGRTRTTSRPASRAYHKLREIVRTCALPTPRDALLLCEAPGGFVQACHDLFPHARLVASSLVADDAIRFHPSVVEQHEIVREFADGRGDIRDARVRDELVRVAQSVDLVTCDAGTEVDHEHVERESHATSIAACSVATRVLRDGGTLVLKLFECSLPCTMRLICDICGRFDHVSLLKPTTSRAINSERYLVATGYDRRRRGTPPSLSMTLSVPRSWARRVVEVVATLNDAQIRALDRALRLAS